MNDDDIIALLLRFAGTIFGAWLAAVTLFVLLGLAVVAFGRPVEGGTSDEAPPGWCSCR